MSPFCIHFALISSVITILAFTKCNSFSVEQSSITSKRLYRTAITTAKVRKTSHVHSIGTYIPSWSEIESSLEPSFHYANPNPLLSIDSALNEKRPIYSETHPTLFRERNGWCPYSERVWLALEVKNIPYNEIRIENSGYGRRPSYFSGQTPQIRWPGGLVQGESMDLVRSLDEKYPDDGLNLYPTDIKDEVEEKIREFRNIFPKGARPSSRAAYLFRFDGEPLWKDEFERVLKDTDALLGVNADDGPFFCGSRFTAADIAWCPFLERYAAQLPCLHDGLNPYDTKSYPHLVTWYDAMNELIPEYPCRIKGDASSWRKVLTTAGYGNAGSVPSTVLKRMQEGSLRDISIPLSTDEEKLHQSIWDTYAASRPWVSNNPAMEAASIVTRNREAIIMDFSKRKNSNGNIEIEKGLPVVGDELDTCMRAIVCLLCKDNFGEDIMKECSDVSGVRELTLFLDERMCVPRDMGSLSAQSMKKLFFN